MPSAASGASLPDEPAAARMALATRSWLSVVRAYNLCTAVLTQRLAALDLKLGEHEVLVNLLRAPGITQQGLAERCFVAKSGVSMLVTRMEERGWVARHADRIDARVRLLRLTEPGREVARQAQAIQDEVVRTMTDPSSPEELHLVAETMLRVGRTLEAVLLADAEGSSTARSAVRRAARKATDP
jgi:DNA-binding MarR family transcriptional regulator